MNREQMIEKAARRLRGYLQGHVPNGAWDEYAEDVVDALLPQVTTVEELEDLEVSTALLIVDDGGPRLLRWGTDTGGEFRLWDSDGCRIVPAFYRGLLPLTVVWQP